MVARHVTVPKRLDANYSLLGRLIRRSVNDYHYAEGILILSIAMISIVMVVLFYVAWAFVEPALATDSTGQLAEYYAMAQFGSAVFLVLIAFIGFKPKLEITIEDYCIHIKHGSQKLVLLTSEVLQTEIISASQFHKHYRKYVNTRAFYNRLNDHLLLLDTTNGPVILGLSEEHQATLLSALRSSASTESNTIFEFVA